MSENKRYNCTKKLLVFLSWTAFVKSNGKMLLNLTFSEKSWLCFALLTEGSKRLQVKKLNFLGEFKSLFPLLQELKMKWLKLSCEHHFTCLQIWRFSKKNPQKTRKLENVPKQWYTGDSFPGPSTIKSSKHQLFLGFEAEIYDQRRFLGFSSFLKNSLILKEKEISSFLFKTFVASEQSKKWMQSFLKVSYFFSNKVTTSNQKWPLTHFLHYLWRGGHANAGSTSFFAILC